MVNITSTLCLYFLSRETDYMYIEGCFNILLEPCHFFFYVTLYIFIRIDVSETYCDIHMASAYKNKVGRHQPYYKSNRYMPIMSIQLIESIKLIRGL